MSFIHLHSNRGHAMRINWFSSNEIAVIGVQLLWTIFLPFSAFSVVLFRFYRALCLLFLTYRL